MYAAQFPNGSTRTRLCFSVIRQRISSAVYLFLACAFAGTLNNWETDSIVIRLKSSGSISGPYSYAETVAAPRKDVVPALWDSKDCHNPTIHKLGTEYVLFYIGVGVNATAAPATNASLAALLRLGENAPRYDLVQTIGAAWAHTPEGPWNRIETPLLHATEPWECGGGPACGVSNPAVMVRPDGRLNMFYRGNQDRGIGVASAETWRGPWVKSAASVTGNGIFRGNEVVGLEDMYVWPNPPSTGRPGCHLVIHQEEAGIENVGAHAWTADPMCLDGWRLSSPRPSHAYGPKIRWDNRSETTFASRERPQIVLSEHGWPTHLSNGVITTSWGGPSFTVVAPIAAPA